jgi:IS66 C-terminal element
MRGLLRRKVSHASTPTFARGSKDYLFAGSDTDRDPAAAIYSLLGTAKLNGLDPELYLRHALERIADHPRRVRTSNLQSGASLRRIPVGRGRP